VVAGRAAVRPIENPWTPVPPTEGGSCDSRRVVNRAFPLTGFPISLTSRRGLLTNPLGTVGGAAEWVGVGVPLDTPIQPEKWGDSSTSHREPPSVGNPRPREEGLRKREGRCVGTPPPAFFLRPGGGWGYPPRGGGGVLGDPKNRGPKKCRYPST